MNKISLQFLLIVLFFGTASGAAQKPLRQDANQSEFQDWLIVHNSVPSTFIPHEIAERAGLARNDLIVNLTIVVMRKDSESTETTPMTAADIEGYINDLLGRSEKIEWIHIPQGDGFYYIHQYRNQVGRRTAKLSIAPAGSSDQLSVEVPLLHW